MIYIALRVIVCLLILLISILGILKSKIHKKKLWISLAVAVSFIIASASYLVPIENLFIAFDTPEDAYFYTHQTEKVEDIVYGQDSCLIVGEDSYGFISKKGDGYKLSSFLTFPQDIVFEKTNKGFMHVYKVTGTNDCYLWGTMLASAAIVEVSDEKDSEIKVLPDQDRNEPHPVFVYGVLRHFEKGDAIYLSGVYEDIKIVLS